MINRLYQNLRKGITTVVLVISIAFYTFSCGTEGSGGNSGTPNTNPANPTQQSYIIQPVYLTVDSNGNFDPDHYLDENLPLQKYELVLKGDTTTDGLYDSDNPNIKVIDTVYIGKDANGNNMYRAELPAQNISEQIGTIGLSAKLNRSGSNTTGFEIGSYLVQVPSDKEICEQNPIMVWDVLPYWDPITNEQKLYKSCQYGQ